MKIKLFSALLVLFILFGFLVIYNAKFKNIEVVDNDGCLPNQDILEKTGLGKKVTFIVKEDEIKNEIEKEFPCAQVEKIEKKYPSTLKIFLQKNRLLVKIPNTLLAINNMREVVASGEESKNLPTLDFPKAGELKQGTKVNDFSVDFALQLARELTKTDFAFQSLRVVDTNSIAAYAKGELIILFSQNKDLILQVDSLQQVLARAKIDESKIAKIDLRFDKPVIEYK